MKKAALLLTACAGMVSMASAQVSYGLKAGVNLPKTVVTASALGTSVSVTTSSATSFHLTGFAEIPAAPNFAVQPGLSLQGKGGETEDVTGKSTLNIMSIEVPVNAVYYIPTGPAGSFFLGAGPYLGLNVSGTEKDGDGVKTDVEFGTADGEYRQIDYGLNFMGGFKLSGGFLINAGYGLGLANVMGLEQSGVSVKSHNRVLSFGIGFVF